MPYSITTKDGITLQGIPDDVPADSPQLKDRVAKIRMQSTPEPSDRDKLLSSGAMRFARGMKDPIDGLAQLASRVPGAGMVNDAANATGNFLNKQIFNRVGLPGDFAGEVLGIRGARPEQMDAEIKASEKEYQSARQATAPRTPSSLLDGKVDPGTDWARLGGNVASPVNAALGVNLPAATSTLGRVGTGMLAGAAGGAMTPVEDSQNYASSKAAQVGLGAALGGVTSPLLGKLGDKVVGYFANKAKPVTSAEVESAVRKVAAESGQKWDDLEPAIQASLRQEAVGALEASKAKLDPSALMRSRDFQQEGMSPTLGQITRDAGQFARERNLRTMSGVGDPLLQRFEQQGQQLQEKMGRYSSGASEGVTAGEKLAQALRAKDESLRSAVSKEYHAARAAAGKDAEVPLGGLSSDLADVIDRYGEKVPSGVLNQFRKYGVLPEQAGAQSPRKLFTVEEADRLIKTINDNKSADPGVNSALTELRNSVKKAITADAGVEDVFAPARAAAAARFKLQEAVPALEAAANGSTAPDDFVRKFVINGKTKDVQGMARILKESSPEAYGEARAQIGAQLQRAAFGENVAGDKAFSPERYAKALRDMGTEKLGAFFEKGEIDQLQRLGRIGAYINSMPNSSPVQSSNNWGAIMSAASKIPGVSPFVGIANSAKNAATNQTAVNSALAAQVPKTQAKLTPEEIQMVSRLLGGASLNAGVVAAQPMK